LYDIYDRPKLDIVEGLPKVFEVFVDMFVEPVYKLDLSILIFFYPITDLFISSLTYSGYTTWVGIAIGSSR